MSTGRLEAFNDGVIAIIITIMVLQLEVPHGSDLQALRPLLPVLLSYVLSFVYVGIVLAFVHERVSQLLYVAVALAWFIPDRRIAALLSE